MADRVPHSTSKTGHQLWTSETLTGAWTCPDTREPFGLAWIGELTFESAAYVARYCTKKVNGAAAEQHYQGRKPEFATMSSGSGPDHPNPAFRRGIGYGWIEKFGDSDVFIHDEVVARGHASKPPRYYDKVLREKSEDRYALMKELRQAKERDEENTTPRRLKDREAVTKARMRTFNTRENQ